MDRGPNRRDAHVSHDPIASALIGCGQVLRHHLNSWKKVPEARIVAVCDPNPDRLEVALALVPDATAHQDAGAMFDDQTFDFVEICTQPMPTASSSNWPRGTTPTSSARSPPRWSGRSFGR